MDRPYLNESIESLEQMVHTRDDPQLVAAVIGELGHRRGRRARKLLHQLAPANGATAAAEPGEPNSNHVQPEPTPQAARTYGVVDEAVTSDLVARYAALRATFTAEAEVLARWGMTGLMPEEMRSLVFDSWRARLDGNSDAHPLGMTLDELAQDRALLDEELRARERAAR